MKWRHCDCRAQLKPHTLEHVHSCSSFSICCCSNDICRQPNLNTQINTSTQNAQFSLHRCLEFMHSKTYQCYQVLEWAMTAQFSQQMVCICVGKQTDLKWKLDTHQRAIFVLQMLLSRHSQWPSAYYATVFLHTDMLCPLQITGLWMQCGIQNVLEALLQTLGMHLN